MLYTPVVETEAWAWVNGRYAGHRPYREAYERPNELALDVTDAIQPGRTNLIALRVNTGLNAAAAAGGLGSRLFLYSPKARHGPGLVLGAPSADPLTPPSCEAAPPRVGC